MFKLALCLFLAVSVTSACHEHPTIMAAPGTSVTTTTTTTTTSSVSGGGSEGGALSGADKALIASSWEKMRKNGKVTPQILYRFLTANPQYQKKFSSFADVPQDQLLKNGNFLAQAYTIMAGVNVVVRSLSIPELLQAEASHLGKSHFARQVTVPMFEQFARSAIDAMTEYGNLSSEEIRAWENGLAALIAAISKSLKNADDVPNVLTGLTPNQISDVQRSWGNIKGDRNSLVNAVFQKLFKAHPGLQSKFDAFRDVAPGDLSSNSAYNAQVALVANRLDSMIAVLNTPLKISGQIRYMAFSHKPRGVLRSEFQEFADVFTSLLAAKGVTDGDMASWRAVLNNMVGGIGKIQGL